MKITKCKKCKSDNIIFNFQDKEYVCLDCRYSVSDNMTLSKKAFKEFSKAWKDEIASLRNERRLQEIRKEAKEIIRIERKDDEGEDSYDIMVEFINKLAEQEE